MTVLLSYEPLCVCVCVCVGGGGGGGDTSITLTGSLIETERACNSSNHSHNDVVDGYVDELDKVANETHNGKAYSSR